MIGTSQLPPQRFPFPGRAFLLATLLATAAGCGGGGGGGAPVEGPTIVTAAVTTNPPGAGDGLLLFFSTDVTLVAGTLFTDADVALASGDTLGNVTTPPVLVNTRTIRVTLGTGVVLAASSSTIALGAGNDCVATSGGVLGNTGDPVVVTAGDGTPPVLSRVTLNAIADELNGRGPAGGTLQLPPNGWVVDLTYSDALGIDVARTQVTANVPVGTPAGTRPAGANLRPFLTTLAATNTAASYLVPAAVTFPQGPVTLTCYVVDVTGLASSGASFTATVRNWTTALRPFETIANPSQVWFVDLSRDVESFQAVANGGGASVNVIAGANSRPDLDDLLLILGLHSSTPVQVQPGLDSNQAVSQQFRTELLAHLATLYSGCNIAFTLTRPGGSFGSSTSIPYNSFGYSQISLAGSADDSGGSGILGIAIFDPSNTTQNNNSTLNFSGNRLGVFLHTIVDAGLAPPSSSPFRLTFDPFTPVVGGTPIGNQGGDATRLQAVLAGTATTGREGLMATAITSLARFAATVLAHECGHSMGLVQNGAMPTGLYGNDPVNFPGSTDGHIRNGQPMYPTGATNVMSPTLTFSAAISPNTTFNSLNLAYLREQVFYGN